LFDKSHLDYHLEKNAKHPTLAEMTRKAIQVLQKSDTGFFLFVEGGKIDIAHHDNLVCMPWLINLPFRRFCKRPDGWDSPFTFKIL